MKITLGVEENQSGRTATQILLQISPDFKPVISDLPSAFVPGCEQRALPSSVLTMKMIYIISQSETIHANVKIVVQNLLSGF